jgi:methylmalonyl-CoA carboxyltransferase 12S subunit
MAMKKATQAELLAAIAALREEVAALAARVAALEPKAPVAAPPTPEARKEQEGIPEEVILAISAAIAAFLGKRPRIRQIRLIGSAAWAQQGRVSIQASHALALRHE